MIKKQLVEEFNTVLDNNPFTRNSDNYTIKNLFGVNLNQSETIQLGQKIETWVNRILYKMDNVKCYTIKKLWINTETNHVQEGGKSKNMKDVDILFKVNNISHYLELKTNLQLDTEKQKATREKIKIITSCLNKNGKYGKVVGKILSPFWAKNSSIINPFKNDEVMWISELFNLVELNITESEYNDVCIEIGKNITKRLNSRVDLEEFMK
tara:strand:- start:27 stop:656 length:630 start_codon:yes stop_codon:yes gene_type:complete